MSRGPRWVRRARELLRKPPGHLARRFAEEVRHELDRFRVPAFASRLDERALLAATSAPSVDTLWRRLIEAPAWPFHRWTPGTALPASLSQERDRVLAAADRALAHEIDLLGSGPVQLASAIDWERDYKSGHRWPRGYFRGIDYVNRGQPSDVKTVWELSRLHWLLPAGQAYAITGDERYAHAARDIVDHWIATNPVACSVNWGVTMEPAMRIFTLSWLLMTFGRSAAWQSPEFRFRYLKSLYLHAWFTERFIERYETNGNHLTADAAALVVAGSIFGGCADGRRWLGLGWGELEREIVAQVHDDGVDFEASSAYHRLVCELFCFAGMFAEKSGRTVGAAYRERVCAMARFIAAYTGPDGLAPLWGDADDARSLPMGAQELRDHRYLVGVVALWLGDESLLRMAGGSPTEAFWLLGPGILDGWPPEGVEPDSHAFAAGGVYVMRGSGDHVFIDCGDVGLAGRGGHGHNDNLSFEACLAGIRLVTDSGCYLYTADFAARNRYRSTAAHNTPCIDGEEVNRFLGPEILWLLHNDARPEPRSWTCGATIDGFEGSHTGYTRLADPVRPVRRFRLDRSRHELQVSDRFEGEGEHTVEIPLHLAAGVEVEEQVAGFRLLASGLRFDLHWSGSAGWSVQAMPYEVAPSYGRLERAVRIVWRARGAAKDLSLDVVLRLSVN